MTLAPLWLGIVMGVLSDIIIADPTEAQAIVELQGGHSTGWPSLDSKGIDSIKLGTLWTVISGGSLDDIHSIVAFMSDESLVFQESEEGPWVFAVPDQLTDALSVMSEADQKRIAANWAETEEFKLDGWAPDDVKAYLADLVRHAKQATKIGKPLLLWMSL